MKARVANRIVLSCIAAAFAFFIGGAATNAEPAPNNAIPDFSSGGKSWVLTGSPVFRKVPGDTGPGPITDKPGKEYKFGQQNAVADTSTPILKPWANKLMDIENARVEAGGLPSVDDSRCWPGGVPSLLLFP